MDYFYLHGFASGPKSSKALILRDRLHAQGITLTIPDFNQPNFRELTLTRQLQQVEALFSKDKPVTLIGSSFGGATAAWLAQRNPQVQNLVLLAPAFGFATYHRSVLTPDQITRWRSDEPLSVYHYAQQKELLLDYKFVEDLQQYDESELTRSVNTTIIHGIHDTVIPVQSSRDYVRDRPWCSLIEVESEHGLDNAIDQIWTLVLTLNSYYDLN
jgi:uncharacterized protein